MQIMVGIICVWFCLSIFFWVLFQEMGVEAFEAECVAKAEARAAQALMPLVCMAALIIANHGSNFAWQIRSSSPVSLMKL